MELTEIKLMKVYCVTGIMSSGHVALLSLKTCIDAAATILSTNVLMLTSVRLF